MNAVPLLSQKILYLESLEDRIIYLEDKNAQLEEVVLTLKSQFEIFSQNRDHPGQGQAQVQGIVACRTSNNNGSQQPDDNDNAAVDDVEEPNPMEIMDILQNTDSGSDRDDPDLVIGDLETPTPTPTPSVISNYEAFTPMSGISEAYSTYSTYSRYSNCSSLISQSGRPMRVCPVCGRPVANFHNHMKTHSAERPYKCTLVGCEASFKRSDNLKNHILYVHLQLRRQRRDRISTNTRTRNNLRNPNTDTIANNNILDAPAPTSTSTYNNYNYNYN